MKACNSVGLAVLALALLVGYAEGDAPADTSKPPSAKKRAAASFRAAASANDFRYLCQGSCGSISASSAH